MNPVDVLDALRSVVDPQSGKDIVRLKFVRDLRVDGDRVALRLVLPDPTAAFSGEVDELGSAAIRRLFPNADVDITLDNEMIGFGDDISIDRDATAGTVPSILNIIAVASGKGGVGKSTVAVNLACALSARGLDVGLMDADIYGPSIPTMFGVADAKPRVNDNRKLVPIETHGIKLLSMGFMVEPDKAVIWRGPMVSNAVRQFFGDTHWGDLDYLVMDLPPGTGDIQLTIVQTIGLTGAVVVSTPQEVALADARKAVAMFQQVDVPVLGLVENMAYFTPPDLPDRRYAIFGEGGTRRLAESLGVPLLGEIPLEQTLREACDEGTPYVIAAPDSRMAGVFDRLAAETVNQVDLRNAGLDPTQRIEILYR
jgi:ATP-binding protein involved in chromosome partitioning